MFPCSIITSINFIYEKSSLELCLEPRDDCIWLCIGIIYKRRLSGFGQRCLSITFTATSMHQELATLFSRTITTYLVTGRREDGQNQSQLSVTVHRTFSAGPGLGCASVFVIVSMTARAIRIIDFMVDNILQTIRLLASSSQLNVELTFNV